MASDALGGRTERPGNPEARRSEVARPHRARRTLEPTFHSRFECKYMVDPSVVPEIRHFLASFTEPDAFAAKCPGFRYPISSLYLDSPSLDLYQQTVNGEMDRFKLRIRTYDDNPASPAFLEVKRKHNNVVHKRRAGISRDRNQSRALFFDVSTTLCSFLL